MNASHYLCNLLVKLSLHYLLANALFTEGLTQDQYVGCFYDNNSELPEGEISISSNSMNIELCIKHCRVTGRSTYAKLQNGTVCQCGDDYGVQLSDLACNVTCAGNRSQYCGGSTNEQFTTYVVYAVCPIGNYGATCDGVCHCKRHTPCDRITGQCPDGCDRGYSGSTCSTTISSTYIGCFEDDGMVRALPNRVHFEEPYRVTIEVCIGWCSENYSSFAGAQYGEECYCGESYDQYGQLNESRCSRACKGNRNEICGGDYANSVFYVCPAGYYGDGCSRTCNCLNEGRCAFGNGSCFSSLCKPGWTGISCNIRDCATLNGDCGTNETCTTADLRFANLHTCRCTEGFERNKIWQSCTDIDECFETPSICGPEAVSCSNTYGSYICHCNNGNTIRNGTCTAMDVDECAKTPSICGTEAVSCSNTYGSYICHCNNGNTMRNATCTVMEISQQIGRDVILGAVLGSLLGLALIALVTFVAILLYRRNRRETHSAEVLESRPDPQSTEPEQLYSTLAEVAGQPSNVYDSLNPETSNFVKVQAQPDSISSVAPHTSNGTGRS